MEEEKESPCWIDEAIRVDKQKIEKKKDVMKCELQEMRSKAPSFLTERYLNGNEGLESREVPLPRRFRGANF